MLSQALCSICSFNATTTTKAFYWAAKSSVKMNWERCRDDSMAFKWTQLVHTATQKCCQSNNKGSSSVYCCNCYTTWPAGPSVVLPHVSALCRILESYQVTWISGKPVTIQKHDANLAAKLGKDLKLGPTYNTYLSTSKDAALKELGWCSSRGLSWDLINLESWWSFVQSILLYLVNCEQIKVIILRLRQHWWLAVLQSDLSIEDRTQSLKDSIGPS